MSYGIATVKGSAQPFGYWSVSDWIESVIRSFPKPFSVAPLKGKYYGTTVLDAAGTPVLSFWMNDGSYPSQREKDKFSGWTPERWSDYCCDSHWESALSLGVARCVVEHLNSTKDQMDDVILMYIVNNARWCEEVFSIVRDGGVRENRRMLKGEFQP